MAFQNRQKNETIRDRELAANERFYDGLELVLCERRTAAIYLLGYCAEILIKNAYYRFRQIPPTQTLPSFKKQLATLKLKLKNGTHDLEEWCDILISDRKANNNQMDPVVAGLVKTHIAKIQLHWKETLRYSPIAANQSEVIEVYDSVDWILKNHQKLWS